MPRQSFKTRAAADLRASSSSRPKFKITPSALLTGQRGHACYIAPAQKLRSTDSDGRLRNRIFLLELSSQLSVLQDRSFILEIASRQNSMGNSTGYNRPWKKYGNLDCSRRRRNGRADEPASVRGLQRSARLPVQPPAPGSRRRENAIRRTRDFCGLAKSWNRGRSGAMTKISFASSKSAQH